MQPRWKYARPSLRTCGAPRLVPVGRGHLSEVPIMDYGSASQAIEERRSKADGLRLAALLVDSVARLMALTNNWRPVRSSRSTTAP